MRKFGRTDNNHLAVAKAMRDMGCTVVSLADIGKGVPDLLCGIRGQTFLVEVKDGTKRPSHKRLTTDEEKFHQDWRGGLLAVVESVDEAIALVKRVCQT